tara:strand:+ start:2045 stop:2824 length:780 start_codon:yes stop_codon:yes gene_type:complete
MANLKFTGFSAVAPVSTTLMVGVAGGVNTKFTVGDIQLPDLGGTLPISSGGTGETTQPLALDAITDAANQVANDVLYIDNSGPTPVAAFKNISQITGVGIPDVVTYMEWTGTTNPYINFLNGVDTVIPYDTIRLSYSTSSTAGNTVIQLVSPTETSFEVSQPAFYRVSVNIHFFDLFGDIDIFCGVYNVGGALLPAGGLIDKKDVTGNTDQNFFGSSVMQLINGQPVEIKANFSGGSGQNPFPSNTGNLFTSVLIERMS